MDRERRSRLLDRRAFVRAVVSVAVTAGLPRRSEPQASSELVIAFVGPSTGASRTGFNFGVREAEQSATLFRKRVRAVVPAAWKQGGIQRLVTDLSRQRVDVIVSALENDGALELAKACADARLVFMNANARSNDLRRSLCSPFVFHVEGSDAMYTAASATAAIQGSLIALWDSSLEKYGAAQLNDRYRSVTGSEMTGPAWATWIAVKSVAEAYFRAADPSPASIASWLGADGSQFDGHKGAPLSFRSWDHQLRQPLYAISGKAVTDIPDIGRSSEPARELLDRLGDSQSASHCVAARNE